MISADGRVIGWGIFIWIGLISALNCPSVAKTLNPHATTHLQAIAHPGQTNARLVTYHTTDLPRKAPQIIELASAEASNPPGEQTPQVEDAPETNNATPPATAQAPAVEVTTPEVAIPSVDETPDTEALPSAADAATQVQDQGPEAEGALPDTGAPSTEPDSIADPLPAADDAAFQAQEEALEAGGTASDTSTSLTEPDTPVTLLPAADDATSQVQEEMPEAEEAALDTAAPLTAPDASADPLSDMDDTATQEQGQAPATEGALPNIPPLPSNEQSPETVGIDGATTQGNKTSPITEAPSVIATPTDVENKSLWQSLFRNIETSFMLTSGLRKDDFQWSIAGNGAGTGPNVLSQLTWSDVDSYYTALSNRTIFNRNLYFRGVLDYAFIQNGRIQDSDYRVDNRQDEYSRSISNSGGDQIWDISIGAGYPFYFMQDRLMLAPLLGYAYHAQNLRIQDGVQVITWASGPDLGPLDGLNSTYRSVWHGPWFGFDLSYRPSTKAFGGRYPMAFGFSLEYHYADYEAEANWNLRSDFQHPVSFEHFADGQGISLSAEWHLGLSAQWDFVFQTTFQRWKTGNGLDQVYNSNGTIGQTRLNEVEWRNHSMVVGANYRF